MNLIYNFDVNWPQSWEYVCPKCNFAKKKYSSLSGLDLCHVLIPVSKLWYSQCEHYVKIINSHSFLEKSNDTFTIEWTLGISAWINFECVRILNSMLSFCFQGFVTIEPCPRVEVLIKSLVLQHSPTPGPGDTRRLMRVTSLQLQWSQSRIFAQY